MSIPWLSIFKRNKKSIFKLFDFNFSFNLWQKKSRSNGKVQHIFYQTRFPHQFSRWYKNRTCPIWHSLMFYKNSYFFILFADIYLIKVFRNQYCVLICYILIHIEGGNDERYTFIYQFNSKEEFTRMLSSCMNC